MRTFILGLVGLLAIVGAGKSSRADVLTFDSLPVMANGDASAGLNGYGGLTWSNFAYLSGTRVGVGYANGVVSPNNVAFNPGGNPASISAATGTFTLISAYFTAAWRDGMQITVTGYNGANLVDTQQFIVNTTGPVLETFHFAGITSVDFSTSGGTIHPGYNLQDTNGEQLVMDNFSYATPEPSSWLPAALGAIGLLLSARRRMA